MPIVSRALDYAREQADGRFRCRVSAIDSFGRNWPHGPFWTASVLEAEGIRDTVTFDLAEAEVADAVTFTEEGGDPSTLTGVDQTTTQLRRRLLKRFANNSVHLDRSFVCGVSTFITTFTAQQLANALGISLAKGTKILNRAIALRDTTCPALVADDADVENVV
jgi:hypothetical protein